MRKETQPLKVCAICKLPITSEQLPAVQLKNGDEIHVECLRQTGRGLRATQTSLDAKQNFKLRIGKSLEAIVRGSHASKIAKHGAA